MISFLASNRGQNNPHTPPSHHVQYEGGSWSWMLLSVNCAMSFIDPSHTFAQQGRSSKVVDLHAELYPHVLLTSSFQTWHPMWQTTPRGLLRITSTLADEIRVHFHMTAKSGHIWSDGCTNASPLNHLFSDAVAIRPLLFLATASSEIWRLLYRLQPPRSLPADGHTVHCKRWTQDLSGAGCSTLNPKPGLSCRVPGLEVHMLAMSLLDRLHRSTARPHL